MKKFIIESPEKKALLGMGGALIFFHLAHTHPSGTPLIAILLGPFIGVALAGISLLLQAAFFAHGASVHGARMSWRSAFSAAFSDGVLIVWPESWDYLYGLRDLPEDSSETLWSIRLQE